MGSTEVYFGNETRERELPDKDVVLTGLHMSNLKVSEQETQYICKNFKLSELGINEEVHAVKMKPIIDNAKNSSSYDFICLF